MADTGLASTMNIDCLMCDFHGQQGPTLVRQSRQAPGRLLTPRAGVSQHTLNAMSQPKGLIKKK
jgi:hypothetical protein